MSKPKQSEVVVSDAAILKAMGVYGGSFVKALAAAAALADGKNLARIKLAWPEYLDPLSKNGPTYSGLRFVRKAQSQL